MAVPRDNVRAVTVMLFAVAIFSAMDAFLKVLSPHYPAFQIVALRALASLPIVIVWVGVSGGFRRLLDARFPLHIARGIIGVFMLATFAYGLRHLPLAEAYAIFFLAPILITVLAALILRETVGPNRWIAIIVGFVGVLVVLRPTGAGTVTLAGVAIVGTAIGYALSAIIVRILSRTDSTQTMVFWLMVVQAIGGTALALPSWQPIQSAHWLVIAGVAITGYLGQWAITEAFALGEASVLAPLEYTALAWGVLADWLVWHALPGAMTFIGAGVIVASGIYLVRREVVHVEAEHP